MTTFGARLRALRKQQGKTQRQVAKELRLYGGLSVNQAYLSRLEAQSKIPGQRILEALARYYRVAPASFLESEVGAPFEVPEPPTIEDPY